MPLASATAAGDVLARRTGGRSPAAPAAMTVYPGGVWGMRSLMDPAWVGYEDAHPEEDPMSSSGENTPDTQADPQTHLDTDPVNAPDPETDLAGNPVEENDEQGDT